MREARSGALATLMAGSGDPYCSLVNVASAADGAPLLLISRLAVHTKNILADARVSLMLDERKPGDPLQGARVMLMGTAAKTDERGRAAPLSRAPARGGDVRGLRRFCVLRDEAQGRASGRRLRPHRRSQAGRSADRSRRRRGAGRGRARRDRAHERGSRRHLPALRHQAARRAGRRLALRRLRSGRARSAARAHRRCGCRSRSACRSPACCARCSSNWRTRRAPPERRVAAHRCPRMDDAPRGCGKTRSPTDSIMGGSSCVVLLAGSAACARRHARHRTVEGPSCCAAWARSISAAASSR